MLYVFAVCVIYIKSRLYILTVKCCLVCYKKNSHLVDVIIVIIAYNSTILAMYDFALSRIASIISTPDNKTYQHIFCWGGGGCLLIGYTVNSQDISNVQQTHMRLVVSTCFNCNVATPLICNNITIQCCMFFVVGRLAGVVSSPDPASLYKWLLQLFSQRSFINWMVRHFIA